MCLCKSSFAFIIDMLQPHGHFKFWNKWLLEKFLNIPLIVPSFPPDWLLLLLAAVAMFVFLLNMNYASFVRHCPTTKQSIIEFVTGKYLALQYSKVFWDWDEPQVVGKAMTFRVKVCKGWCPNCCHWCMQLTQIHTKCSGIAKGKYYPALTEYGSCLSIDETQSIKLTFRQYPAIYTNYSWSNCTISN